MSEISITRFQPAPVTREKVNSVGTVENDLEAKPDRQETPQRDNQPHEQWRRGSQLQQGDSGSREASEADLEQAVLRLNDYVQSVKRDIIFDFDPDSGEPSVTVVDRESRKMLRQFDSKEALELAQKLDKQEPISLFKTQV